MKDRNNILCVDPVVSVRDKGGEQELLERVATEVSWEIYFLIRFFYFILP